MIVKFHLLR